MYDHSTSWPTGRSRYSEVSGRDFNQWDMLRLPDRPGVITRNRNFSRETKLKLYVLPALYVTTSFNPSVKTTVLTRHRHWWISSCFRHVSTSWGLRLDGPSVIKRFLIFSSWSSQTRRDISIDLWFEVVTKVWHPIFGLWNISERPFCRGPPWTIKTYDRRKRPYQGLKLIPRT